MRNRPVAASMRKSIVSSVVFAGLTSLALLGRVESVSAMSMTSCQAKHADCSARCIINDKGDACIQRTCTHQFKACAAVSGESSNPYHGYEYKPRGDEPKPDASALPGRGLEGRPGGGVGVGRPGGGRPGRDASQTRDHRGPRGRGPRPTQLTSQSPSSPADQVRTPRGPLGGGILDSLGLGGVRQQGPAASGSPMAPAAAPSAPPVIIR
jgi:hypothetical protein